MVILDLLQRVGGLGQGRQPLDEVVGEREELVLVGLGGEGRAEDQLGLDHGKIHTD